MRGRAPPYLALQIVVAQLVTRGLVGAQAVRGRAPPYLALQIVVAQLVSGRVSPHLAWRIAVWKRVGRMVGRSRLTSAQGLVWLMGMRETSAQILVWAMGRREALTPFGRWS